MTLTLSIFKFFQSFLLPRWYVHVASIAFTIHRSTQGLIRVYIFQYDRYSFAVRVGRKGGLVLLFKPAGNYCLQLVLKHQIHLKILKVKATCKLSAVSLFPFLTFVHQSWVYFSWKMSAEFFSSFSWKINVKMDNFGSCIVHNHLYFVWFYLNFLNTTFNSVGS